MDRETLVDQIDEALDVPMAILAGASLILIIIDLTVDVTPRARFWFEIIFWFTWTMFALEFLVKILIAENKRRYIRGHWIDLAIVFVPFLRVLRVLRIARITSSLALLRLFLYGTRGLSELGILLSTRILYLSAVSTFVVIFGSIGAYIIESAAQQSVIKTYGDALWWTASMVVGQEASNLFPVTAAGRVLSVFFLMYSVAIFAFLAASFASFLLGKEAARRRAD